MSEKLQKVLARIGLGSRRYMEEVIAAGRVSVNGQIAQVGERIEPGDELRIDGRKVQFQIEDEIRRRVLIYYKPEGEICSRNDPEQRPTVFEHLPPINNDRWVMVGRLDINSTGLLLFTNDGELANRLMHPSNEIEREYAVRVMGEVTPQLRQNMMNGVVLDDGPAKFETFTDLGGEGINRWYQVVVKEGRNREVRRIFESQGLKVSRLLRTRYGTVILPRELRTGRWVELDKSDIDNLTKVVDLKPRQGTGLYGMAKRRNERMQEKPMAARRGGYLRQQRRDQDEQVEEQTNGQQQPRPAATESGAQPQQDQQRTYRSNERNQFGGNRSNERNQFGGNRSNERNQFSGNRSNERSQFSGTRGNERSQFGGNRSTQDNEFAKDSYPKKRDEPFVQRKSSGIKKTFKKF
ncbi:ribosomal large subunit pseudouridine synthase B [Acinetobacter calcoaceticus]|uniref:Pseudouridine synthase n=1 Tax=Acinetobacter calcoaceticus TaxID=471 RepID=A0A4R1XUA3_ACICA|nr:ribosomal large subunit pseudouridine synthase B [Acinetobacter calcoaceticus]